MTEQMKDQIVKLRQEPMPVREIVAMTGMSTKTVCRVLKERGLAGDYVFAKKTGRRRTRVERAIIDYGVVEAEELPSETGFVVTVGDEYVGSGETFAKALEAALQDAEGKR